MKIDLGVFEKSAEQKRLEKKIIIEKKKPFPSKKKILRKGLSIQAACP